jgi:hypothetical protein
VRRIVDFGAFVRSCRTRKHYSTCPNRSHRTERVEDVLKRKGWSKSSTWSALQDPLSRKALLPLRRFRARPPGGAVVMAGAAADPAIVTEDEAAATEIADRLRRAVDQKEAARVRQRVNRERSARRGAALKPGPRGPP